MPKNHKKIILKAEDIRSIVIKLKKEGKKIVLTQGTFDLVHIGHARYCVEAKRHGDILIVGVDSDEKVKQRKGDDRPVVPQDERLEMLTYLGSVDYVVLKELEAPKYNLIQLVQPDVLIATRETYTAAQIKQVKQWCQQVIVLDPQATTSTSAKIRRMQIGMAKKIADNLGRKLIATIEGAVKELKGEP